jgi:hypothetical protein
MKPNNGMAMPPLVSPLNQNANTLFQNSVLNNTFNPLQSLMMNYPPLFQGGINNSPNALNMRMAPNLNGNLSFFDQQFDNQQQQLNQFNNNFHSPNAMNSNLINFPSLAPNNIGVNNQLQQLQFQQQ